MTFTGLTPLLDSRIAAGKCDCFVDFRSGAMYDRVGGRTFTGSVNLQRNGLYIPQGFPATASSILGLTTEGTVMISCMPLSNAAEATNDLIDDINIGTAKGLTLNFSATNTFQVTIYSSGGIKSKNLAGGGAFNIKRVYSMTFKNNDVLQSYVNGVATTGAATSLAGETFVPSDLVLRVGGRAASRFMRENVYWAYIDKEVLTEAQQQTLIDELDNQIRYETQDCFWPVSATVYWRGAFGALADETARAAGRSIGDINELVVASGTHKMSTEKLDGILTKCLVCVTNGTINLPAYNLGANYVFEKFTASTGLWTTVTQASRAVALLAGDKILWANQTGNRHIKRIY